MFYLGADDGGRGGISCDCCEDRGGGREVGESFRSSLGADCFVALALLFAVVMKGDACPFWPPRRVQWWSSLVELLLLPASSLTRNIVEIVVGDSHLGPRRSVRTIRFYSMNRHTQHATSSVSAIILASLPKDRRPPVCALPLDRALVSVGRGGGMRTGFCRLGRPTEGRRPMWMEVHQPADLKTDDAPDFLHAGQCSRGRFPPVFLKPQLRTEFCVFLHRAADTDHRRACVWACGPTDRRPRACARMRGAARHRAGWRTRFRSRRSRRRSSSSSPNTRPRCAEYCPARGGVRSRISHPRVVCGGDIFLFKPQNKYGGGGNGHRRPSCGVGAWRRSALRPTSQRRRRRRRCGLICASATASGLDATTRELPPGEGVGAPSLVEGGWVVARRVAPSRPPRDRRRPAPRRLPLGCSHAATPPNHHRHIACSVARSLSCRFRVGSGGRRSGGSSRGAAPTSAHGRSRWRAVATTACRRRRHHKGGERGGGRASITQI